MCNDCYIRNSKGLLGYVCRIMNSSNQFHVLGEGHVPLSDEDSEPVTDFAEEEEEEERPSFDCPHDYFVKTLEDSELPGDTHGQGAFDNRSDFVLGGPGAHFGGTNRCEYDTSGASPQLVLGPAMDTLSGCLMTMPGEAPPF